MPDKKRVDKRSEQYGKLNNESAKNLVDEIDKLKASKALIDAAEAEKLLDLYAKLGVDLNEEYENAADKSPQKNNLEKTIKKFTKDYVALMNYKKHLEKAKKDDASTISELKKTDKSTAKKKKANPNAGMYNIEEFFENSRTRTVKMSEEEFNSLSTTGAGQNTRYKVNFIVEDESIENKKKGDASLGFFTVSKQTKSTDKFAILNEKADELKKELVKKYPGAKDFISKLTMEQGFAFCANDDTAVSEELRNYPDTFGTAKSMTKSKDLLKQGYFLKFNNDPDVYSELENLVDSIDSSEKLFAFTEFASGLIKENYSLKMREDAGIPYDADVSQRSALTSVYADIFGCSSSVAFAEKMKLQIKKDDKDVVLKGVVMMPAKGTDPNGAESSDPLTLRTGKSYEESKGMTASIAKLQFLNYLTGNIDCHAGNVFVEMGNKNKVKDVQAIDTDTSFGTSTDYDSLPNAIPFSELRIIPKSMADAVRNTKPEVLTVILQGHGLSKEEIEANVTRFKDTQAKLDKIEKAYEGVDPLYIDEKVPRIVPDEEMDKYFVNEQLSSVKRNKFNTVKSNLFGKMIGESNLISGYAYAAANGAKASCEAAKDISTLYYSDGLKKNLKTLTDFGSKDYAENNKEPKNSAEAFEKLAAACGPVATADRKFKHMMLVKGKPSTIDDNLVHATPGFKDFKLQVDKALLAAGKYIELATSEMYTSEGESKFEAYQTAKAEIDFYKKEAAKGENGLPDSKKLLKESQDYLKELEKDPEIIKLNAAIKARDQLTKMSEKMATIEHKVKDLLTAEAKCVEISNKGKNASNDYIGSSIEKKAKQRSANFIKQAIKRPQVRNLDVIKPVSKNAILA